MIPSGLELIELTKALEQAREQSNQAGLPMLACYIPTIEVRTASDLAFIRDRIYLIDRLISTCPPPSEAVIQVLKHLCAVVDAIR